MAVFFFPDMTRQSSQLGPPRIYRYNTFKWQLASVNLTDIQHLFHLHTTNILSAFLGLIAGFEGQCNQCRGGRCACVCGGWVQLNDCCSRLSVAATLNRAPLITVCLAPKSPNANQRNTHFTSRQNPKHLFLDFQIFLSSRTKDLDWIIQPFLSALSPGLVRVSVSGSNQYKGTVCCPGDCCSN